MLAIVRIPLFENPSSGASTWQPVDVHPSYSIASTILYRIHIRFPLFTLIVHIFSQQRRPRPSPNGTLLQYIYELPKRVQLSLHWPFPNRLCGMLALIISILPHHTYHGVRMVLFSFPFHLHFLLLLLQPLLFLFSLRADSLTGITHLIFGPLPCRLFTVVVQCRCFYFPGYWIHLSGLSAFARFLLVFQVCLFRLLFESFSGYAQCDGIISGILFRLFSVNWDLSLVLFAVSSFVILVFGISLCCSVCNDWTLPDYRLHLKDPYPFPPEDASQSWGTF